MKYTICIFLISLFLHSCKDTKDNLDLQIEKIEDLEYENLYSFKQKINELDNFKGSEKAAIYKKYFTLKANLYSCNCNYYVSEINKFYSELKGTKYEKIKSEIDYLLLEHYYFNNEYQELIKIIDRSQSYLFKPEFNIEKVLFFSFMATVRDEIPLNNFQEDLFNLYEKSKEEKYTFKTARIYQAVIQAYRNRNERDKMFKLLEEAEEKNREAKLNKYLIFNNVFYSFNIGNNDNANANILSINKSIKTLSLLKKYGYNYYYNVLYKNNGLRYANLKQFDKSIEHFKMTFNHPQKDPFYVPDANYYSYLGWSNFKNKNVESAFQLYEQGINIAKQDTNLRKSYCNQIIANERKLWSIKALNPDANVDDLKNKIRLLNIKVSKKDDSQHTLEKISIFKLNQIDKDIKNLSAELDINQEKVKSKNYSYFFLAISCIILLLAFGFYLQKNKALKLLQERSLLHKNQNENLNNLLQIVEKNNKQLELIASETATKFHDPLKAITKQTHEIFNSYEESLSENEKEYFRYILIGCQNLNQIINDLLGFSQITQKLPNKELTDLNKLIENVKHSFKDKLNEKQLEVIIENQLPTLFSHKSLFIQLYSNLISNSIKYSNKKNSKILIGSKIIKKNNYLFYVKDFGKGIDKNDQDKIFILFNKLDKKSSISQSSGIGLAVCKKIVEYYNGKIWVDSEPNLGTTIYFSIPQIELI